MSGFAYLETTEGLIVDPQRTYEKEWMKRATYSPSRKLVLALAAIRCAGETCAPGCVSVKTFQGDDFILGVSMVELVEAIKRWNI